MSEAQLRKELKAVFEDVTYGEYDWSDAYDIIEQMIDSKPPVPKRWRCKGCGNLVNESDFVVAIHPENGHKIDTHPYSCGPVVEAS